MASRGLLRLGLEALLLALYAGLLGCTWMAPTASYLGLAQAGENSRELCGWIGVAVSPMTRAFAVSLGMSEPYGAIFGELQPGSPAAAADIEQGDAVTSINGAPLVRASDFAGIIARMAPRTTVYLYTWRNGQPRPVQVILGSAPCGGSP
ncbi:MAG TPA: PDZ domain-containing protein [Xanthobacteraceae bacterium]|jgi:membrane-associated protease RseP (regulator of RpoE activity)